MASISIGRDDYLKLKSGDLSGLDGDSRLASFLINRFEEGEAAAMAEMRDEPTWTYVIWEYRF